MERLYGMDRYYLSHIRQPITLRKRVDEWQTSFMTRCRFKGDGRLMLVSGTAGNVKVYNTKLPDYKYICTRQPLGQTEPIVDMDISKNGFALIAACNKKVSFMNNYRRDETSHVFEMPDYKQNASLVSSVVMNEEAKHFSAGTYSGCCYVFDMLTTQLIDELVMCPEGCEITTVAYLTESPTVLLSGSMTGVVDVWDRRVYNDVEAKAVGSFVGHQGGIYHVDSRMDSRYLCSIAADATVKLWDMRRMYDPVQNFHAGVNVDPITVRLMDTSSVTFQDHGDGGNYCVAKFSPDKTTGAHLIYVGGGKGKVVIYNTISEEAIHLVGNQGDVKDIAWHPERLEIVTIASDRKILQFTHTAPAGATAE